MPALTDDLTCDGFLDGRLRIRQPRRGFRSGADAVMLAAACPARAGQAVLDLGCGAGVASLCLGWRVPGLRLVGLERQDSYAALARRNAAENAIAIEVMTGDLVRPPIRLREQVFDHVIANPPFFRGGTPAPDTDRAVARQEDTPLSVWIDAGLRRLRPGGVLTVIQSAQRLADILAGLDGRAGAVAILPLAGREGRPAGRVIVRAQKGARGPLRLLAPFIMHKGPAHETADGKDVSDLTDSVQAVLRRGAALRNLSGESDVTES